MKRFARGQSEILYTSVTGYSQCDTIICHMTLFISTIWQSLLLYTNTSKLK